MVELFQILPENQSKFLNAFMLIGQQQKPKDLSKLISDKYKLLLILLNIVGLSIICVVFVVVCCDCKPKKKKKKSSTSDSDSDSSDSIPDERTAKFAISSLSNNVEALHTCDSPLVKSSVVSNATDDNVSYEVAMDSNLPEPTKMLSVEDINE
ncbi:hypothetical protein TVAG_382170 [Trichomonas vaginalis G3]|uniref:Uncharacterized protein n=1 Tax=Trichomonas vaginalis (strain ATCC PRA-98 / G3) TaxID=412133 RepID=A2FND6_TRIV3|nr:hypothetical protein TVAGG3_0035330 [Trichomonas vaginalis G3]EAX93572.1 hypothetical protein TVAG_382170 [Trichomonas vaginalis G3]KAI5540338.1 hypothetical protein TVAGG3_0035330 [Trichomonas vaginalis G3]|eukprot:XP_001306502.1 hypothetical protein [Trichomonas vaginalis G3]